MPATSPACVCVMGCPTAWAARHGRDPSIGCPRHGSLACNWSGSQDTLGKWLEVPCFNFPARKMLLVAVLTLKGCCKGKRCHSMPMPRSLWHPVSPR